MRERTSHAVPITTTLLVSVVLPLGLSFFVHASLPASRWADYPVHAIIEGLGAFIAVTLATIILMLRSHERLAPRFTWIAIGLTGMGILDGFHASLYAGQTFVWLHSIAVLFGGVAFAAVWFPLPTSIATLRLGPALAALGAVLLATTALIWPTQLPAMVGPSGFTPVARAINVIGGIGFVVGGLRFLACPTRRSTGECGVFASHALLLGVASLLFEFSTLWDATWWLWHLLRLSAYVIVLYYFLSAYNRMQDELRDNESALANAQRLARLGHWHWHAVDERFAASAMVYDVLGIPMNDPDGVLDDYLQRIHPQDRNTIERALYDTVTRRCAFALEHRVLHQPDDVRDVYVQGESIIDAYGHVVGVRGVMQEITERKRKDVQLRLAGAIYTTTTEAIMVTDPDGVVTDVNPAFLTMTGYGREHIVGRAVSALGHISQDSLLLDTFLARLARTESWRGEMTLRRIDGSVVPLMTSLTTLREPGGHITGHVCLMSDISELKEKQQRIWEMANLDALTGLPNRNLFYDRIEVCMANARRSGSMAALLYIDLDGFKAVNDEHGHSVGDGVLQQAAARMKACLRETDTLARLGGDEFTIILPEIYIVEDAIAVAGKLLNAFAADFHIHNHAIAITASIGIARFPDDAEEADELIRQADDAMYRAKASGRNTVRCADPTLMCQYPSLSTNLDQGNLS